MILEIYASGAKHPPLVDAYIDAQGTLFGMSPEPRQELHDMMQVVLEDDGNCPNFHQRGALHPVRADGPWPPARHNGIARAPCEAAGRG